MRKKVVILGGGVGGLSAAHELAERGFDVCVYERRGIPGGKARSVPVPQTGTEKTKPLPGEHGFRFFPGFYRHVTDTMQRIPYRRNRRGVYDNLVETTRTLVLRSHHAPLLTVSRFPRSLEDLKVLLVGLVQFVTELGLEKADLDFFATRLWQIVTSCGDRRQDEYEKIGWWEYIGAEQRSPAYQQYLASGLSRSLVAAQPKYANTKTDGNILLQLMFKILEPGVGSDRVLNGPTNEVWIDPWLEYLRSLHVAYHPKANVLGINCVDRKITGVRIEEGGRECEVTGDYYLAALPVEVMAALLERARAILAADPTLTGIRALSRDTAWMNGIQFYLREDVPLAHGHELCIDSPWALSCLSQQQFWPDFDLRKRGDGTIGGIISVDISDWKTKGIVYQKPAIDCSREEIRDEVWAQLKCSLNVNGANPLQDANLRTWFLDNDILAREYVQEYRPGKYVNLEPLLVNKINTWHLRPDAYTRIPNLFLAADYVRTNTDLATMEGANEAARRAVNAIVDVSGSTAGSCQIWELHEPPALALWRWHDQKRYEKGLPWRGQLPFWFDLLQRVFGQMGRISSRLASVR